VSTRIEITVTKDRASYKTAKDCYLTVSLDDTDGKQIYGLYFDMVSNGQRSPRLLQFRETFSFSGDVLESDIAPMLKDINKVSVTVTADRYLTALNGQIIEPSLKIQWDRLIAFQSFVIKGGGCCLTADLDDNFMNVKKIGEY
jgi:hypothetical protein